MIKYDMNLTEMDEESGSEVPTVVMAGFNRKKAQKYSWLQLGAEPQERFLQVESQQAPWTSRWMSEQAPDINVMIKQQDDAIRSAMQKATEPDTSNTTADRVPPDSAAPQAKRSTDTATPAPDLQASADTEGDEFADDEEAAWTNMILSRAIEVWLGEN
jgi:hypothetical protein